MVFDEKWFENNNWWIVPLANTFIGRDVLGTDKKRIFKVTPNSIHYRDRDICYGEFRVNNKYSVLLYRKLKPLWQLLHWIDELKIPRLYFGFTSFNEYVPDAGSGATTVDAAVFTEKTNATWSTVQGATTGDGADPLQNDNNIGITSGTVTDRWAGIARAIYTFNTVSLGDIILSSAKLTVYSIDAINNLVGNSFEVGIVSCNPASNDDVVVGDYDSFGTTLYSDKKGVGDLPSLAYVDFIFTGAGVVALVNPNGISKIGMREINHDAANLEPDWTSDEFVVFSIVSADLENSDPVTWANTEPYLTVGYVNKGLEISSVSAITGINSISLT